MKTEEIPSSIVISGRRIQWDVSVNKHAILRLRPYSLYDDDPPTHKKYDMVGEERSIDVAISDCAGLDPDLIAAEIQTVLKGFWILTELHITRDKPSSLKMHFQRNGREYDKLLPEESQG